MVPNTCSHKILSSHIREVKCFSFCFQRVGKPCNRKELFVFSSAAELCEGHNSQLIPKDMQEPHLDDEVSAPKVSNGPGQPRAAPHEAKEEGALSVGEGLHHLPEPLDQGCRGLHPLVRCHRL